MHSRRQLSVETHDGRSPAHHAEVRAHVVHPSLPSRKNQTQTGVTVVRTGISGL